MKLTLPAILLMSIAAVTIQAQGPGAQNSVPKIPTSFLQKAKGYEKALQLQKETGADIFIWFSRQAPSDEKGLCRWFETRGLNSQKVRKHLRDYIKVHVPLPSNPQSQKLAEKFEVRKTPAVFIVHTNGFHLTCKVFDWPGGKPELHTPEDLVEIIKIRSSEKYR